MKSILLISPESWDAHSVSKHHYAMTLARRWGNVFFLDPPDDSLTDFIVRQVESCPGLHIVSTPKVAMGLRYYPSFLRQWLERRWLGRLERYVNTRITVIWLFENSRFFDMRFAGNRLKIYHQVDLNQEFNPKLAASTADICFCTTDFIRERLLPYNSRAYKIHHGLAVSSTPALLTNEQLGRFKQGFVNAVYIGNLEMQYLDIDLLVQAVNECRDVQFHFVGGYIEGGAIRRLAGDLPNVTWWGKVSSSLIPPILECADILLVTYQSARYRDQASPHKFMEYLASGKVIVATYTDEYKDKRNLLEMVDNSADYISAFARVVDNLVEYNHPAKKNLRRKFAQAHTYERQLEKISEILKKNGFASFSS